MTLGDLIAQVRQMAPRDPTGRLQYDAFLIRGFIQNRYREVLGKTRWSFLQKDGAFSTVAPYQTGTISTTAGSTTVTGSGTSWTAANVGMYLAGNTTTPPIKVTAVGSGTSLTLEIAYPTTTSAATYALTQPYYSMPSDFYTPMNKWAIRGGYWRLAETPPVSLDALDPQRFTLSKPSLYAFHGLDSASPPNRQIELWPTPDAVYVMRVRYMQAAPNLVNGTDTPLLPTPQMLQWGALVDCYEYFAATLQQPGLADGARAYAQQYASLIDDAIDRDLPLQSLPDTQDQGLPFILSDDLLVKLGLPINYWV